MKNRTKFEVTRQMANVMTHADLFLRVVIGDNSHVLTYRSVNENIDDPDCNELFQTLKSGVFRRYDVYRGDEKSFRWLHFSSADPNELLSALSDDFEKMTQSDLDELSVQIAMQYGSSHDNEMVSLRM